MTCLLGLEALPLIVLSQDHGGQEYTWTTLVLNQPEGMRLKWVTQALPLSPSYILSTISLTSDQPPAQAARDFPLLTPCFWLGTSCCFLIPEGVANLAESSPRGHNRIDITEFFKREYLPSLPIAG